jgi:hypothetical protein
MRNVEPPDPPIKPESPETIAASLEAAWLLGDPDITEDDVRAAQVAAREAQEAMP